MRYLDRWLVTPAAVRCASVNAIAKPMSLYQGNVDGSALLGTVDRRWTGPRDVPDLWLVGDAPGFGASFVLRDQYQPAG